MSDVLFNCLNQFLEIGLGKASIATADVVSSDPPLIERHIRFTTVPLKALSDQVLDIHAFVLGN